jgi:hypothetical protein
MKTEQACNGLQLAADDDDNFLLQSVENATLTGRIHLLKCAPFRTENGTK